MGYIFNVSDGPTVESLTELQQPHTVKVLTFTLSVKGATLKVGVLATGAIPHPEQDDWWTVSGSINSVVKEGMWDHSSPSPREGFIANYSPESKHKGLSTFSIR